MSWPYVAARQVRNTRRIVIFICATQLREAAACSVEKIYADTKLRPKVHVHRIPRDAQSVGFRSQVEKLLQENTLLIFWCRNAVDLIIHLLRANDAGCDDRTQLRRKVGQPRHDSTRMRFTLMCHLSQLHGIQNFVLLVRRWWLPTKMA